MCPWSGRSWLGGSLAAGTGQHTGQGNHGATGRAVAVVPSDPHARTACRPGHRRGFRDGPSRVGAAIGCRLPRWAQPETAKVAAGTTEVPSGRANPLIHPTGLEPATFGSVDRRTAKTEYTQPSVKPITCDDGKSPATSVLALRLALLVENDPDLTVVVEAWESLVTPVRAGILAMAKAAVGGDPGGHFGQY